VRLLLASGAISNASPGCTRSRRRLGHRRHGELHSWDRELNADLHELYATKLLEPGRGGLLTLEEAEYIRGRLEADVRLRRRWRIRRRRVPLSLVAERAYPEDPEAARRHIKAQQARARRRRLSAGEMSPTADTIATTTRPSTRKNTLDANHFH